MSESKTDNKLMTVMAGVLIVATLFFSYFLYELVDSKNIYNTLQLEYDKYSDYEKSLSHNQKVLLENFEKLKDERYIPRFDNQLHGVDAHTHELFGDEKFSDLLENIDEFVLENIQDRKAKWYIVDINHILLQFEKEKELSIHLYEINSEGNFELNLVKEYGANPKLPEKESSNQYTMEINQVYDLETKELKESYIFAKKDIFLAVDTSRDFEKRGFIYPLEINEKEITPFISKVDKSMSYELEAIEVDDLRESTVIKWDDEGNKLLVDFEYIYDMEKERYYSLNIIKDSFDHVDFVGEYIFLIDVKQPINTSSDVVIERYNWTGEKIDEVRLPSAVSVSEINYKLDIFRTDEEESTYIVELIETIRQRPKWKVNFEHNTFQQMDVKFGIPNEIDLVVLGESVMTASIIENQKTNIYVYDLEMNVLGQFELNGEIDYPVGYDAVKGSVYYSKIDEENTEQVIYELNYNTYEIEEHILSLKITSPMNHLYELKYLEGDIIFKGEY